MDFELDDEQLELQRVVARRRRAGVPAVARAGRGRRRRRRRRGLWKTLRRPRLAEPHRARRATAAWAPSAVELVVIARGARPGGRPDPVPGHDEPVRAARARVRRRRPEPRLTLLAAVCAGGTGAAAFAADTVRARPDGDGWVLDGHGAATCSTATGPTRSPSSPRTDDGVGVFVVPARRRSPPPGTPTFDGALHLADVDARRRARSAGDRAVTGPGVAAGVDRARAGGRRRAGRRHGRRVAAAARPRARPRPGPRTSSACRSGRSRRSSTWPSTCTSPSSGPGRCATSRRWPSPRTTTAGRWPRRWPRRPPATPSASPSQHGVQLFGGLGFTWENDLQLYLRRAKVGELLLGATRRAPGRASARLRPRRRIGAPT